MNMKMSSYKVTEDPEFKEFLLQKPSLTDSSIESYIVALKRFVEFTEEPFFQTVHELRSLQNDRIENNIIIRFDPNQSKTKVLQYGFINELKAQGLRDPSINSYLVRIRTLLSGCGVILPTAPVIDNTPKEWHLLTKEEIKYVLDASDIHYKSLITFLAVTGMRIKDASSLKIKDFMEATKEYHDCTELKDFLAIAPEGMIGFWDFIPSKTKKRNVKCKVCNTPECSNLILFSLNERVKYLERYNEKHNTDYVLSKNDALFGNRQEKYKAHITTKALGTIIGRQKKKLYAEKNRILKYKFEKGEISVETYFDEINRIPNFHAHGLRKFFITTLAKNRVDARISALMEGHVPPIQTDSHYVNDEYLRATVKEEYLRCVPDLSFEKVEVKFLTSEEKRTLEEQVSKMEEKYEELKQDMEEKVKRNEMLADYVSYIMKNEFNYEEKELDKIF